MPGESIETCTWCDRELERDDGWRLQELPGARRAGFCRLEHVVPWSIQGPHWLPGEIAEPRGIADDLTACAHCDAPLSDVYLLLVRHRGEHRVPDAFCSVDHLAAWAKAGGRWQ